MKKYVNLKKKLYKPLKVKFDLKGQSIFCILKSFDSSITFKAPREGFKLLKGSSENIINFSSKPEKFKSFISLFFNHAQGLSHGWLIKLEIRGRGLSLKFKEDYVYFNLGFSHSILYKVPSDIFISCINKRIIYIFGSNLNKISNIADGLIRLAPMNSYKDKGIMKLGSSLKLKQGKRT